MLKDLPRLGVTVRLVADGLRRDGRFRSVAVQNVSRVPATQRREASLAVGAVELVGRRRVDAIGRQVRAATPVPVSAA